MQRKEGRAITKGAMYAFIGDLGIAVWLIGTKAFGVKAVTREAEGRLPVEDGGLGDNPPRGDPPAVMP